MSARAHDFASISWSGKAAGQRVNRSITVNRYLEPFDIGRGPTRSTWMWSNRRVGIGVSCSGARTCSETFDCWHRTQVLAHSVTSFAKPCQMNFDAINFFVGRPAG